MRIIVFLFVCLSFATPLFANGGPLDVSEIKQTGNIELMKKQNISLEEEQLSIRIDGDYAYVNVEYKFKNHGGADKVAYGFPIDQCYGIEYYDDAENTSNGPGDSLVNFKIEDDSGFLKTYKYVRKSPSEVSKHSADDKNHSISIRDWFITDLPFKAYEEKRVKVSYKVKSQEDDMIYSKSFRPEFSDRTFSYLLKPSQNWGDGIVKKMIITVDTRELIKTKGEIKKILPSDFKNKEGILTKEAENFDLKTAEDIKITYDNAAMAFLNFINEERIPNKYILTVKSSSFLKTDKINKANYEPKNVLDNDLNTVWAVKGPGIGEWVEFKLDNIVVTAIGIISGYTKNASLFNANSRPNEIKLDIEWNNQFGTDENEAKSPIVVFQPSEYDEAIKTNPEPFINWLADYGDGRGLIKKLRLTITGVIPGQKYKDTCIAEIYILGHPWSTLEN